MKRYNGYITPDNWGVPNASKEGTKSEVAQIWVDRLCRRCIWAVPNALDRETNSEATYK